MKIDVQLYVSLLEAEVNRLRAIPRKGAAAYLGVPEITDQEVYVPPRNLGNLGTDPVDNLGTTDDN